MDVFSASLVVNVACFVLVAVLPSMSRFTLFVALAFLQLAAYLYVTRAGGFASEEHEASLFEGRREGVGSIVRVFMGCVAAFAFISFTGAGLASLLRGAAVPVGLLFSLGILVGVAVLRLFIKFSPRLDIFESVRWIFPVVGFALACSSSGSAMLLSAGVVMMALSHIAFEGMTRMGIAALAKRSEFSFVQVSALGMASISVGALVGAMSFELLSRLVDSTPVLFSFALALLATLVLILFGAREPAPREARAPLPENEACAIMAQKYGLSPRETEILGYLIEGRSSPYIRDELSISKSTVDTHIRHIYEKSGVSSRQDLISLYKDIRGNGSVEI